MRPLRQAPIRSLPPLRSAARSYLADGSLKRHLWPYRIRVRPTGRTITAYILAVQNSRFGVFTRQCATDEGPAEDLVYTGMGLSGGYLAPVRTRFITRARIAVL